MSMIQCPECKKEISDQADKCPHCGISVPPADPVPAKEEGKSGRGKPCLMLILSAVAAAALAVIVGVAVRTIDEKTFSTGEVKLSTMRSELSEVSGKLSTAKSELAKIEAQIESQSKKIEPLQNIYDAALGAGTYTVGSDLAPGIYHFTYTLKNPDDDWGDYLYVRFADSEGTEETWGGTKFDYRTGAEQDGEQVAIKLDAGSILIVESEYGLWNPGKPPVTAAEN